MQIIADLHTHTLSATHAFNTLDEMAAKAAALGYAALAITDHGPAMPDAPHMWHFANQTALPLVLHGVAMMYGAEANVMDTNGGLDFAQSRLRALDWVVASIHSPCIPGLLTEKEANLEELIGTRSRAITRKLESVQQLEPTEAADLLGLAEGGSRISTQNSEIDQQDNVPRLRRKDDAGMPM